MISEIDKEEDVCGYYTMKFEDVKNCDIAKWYEEFKSATPPTIIIPIPSEVINVVVNQSSFLQATPEPSNFVHQYRRPVSLLDETDDSDSSDSSDGYSQSYLDQQVYEEVGPPPLAPPELSQFKVYEEKIGKAIEDLGGTVMPKLNWVSPNDVVKAEYRELKCKNSNEVLTLLKASAKIKDIVKNRFAKFKIDVSSQTQMKFHLALRKWVVMNPDMEFRCFVCDERLTAITPRNLRNGYLDIVRQRDTIIIDIHNFFCEKIYGQFPENFYVFDVVRLGTGQILLVDFAVFGLPTDPLLFTYRELRMLMEEISSNLNSKPADEKRKSGLRDVFVFGEPYFRYLTENYAYSPLNKKIAPSNIVTYLRDVKTD